MFLEAISNIGSATISIPIAVLKDNTDTLLSTIGVGIPAVAVPHLAKIGLFDHKVAEKIGKGIFEVSGPTLTGQWMDAAPQFRELFPQGVQGGWHRIHGHHFLTDAVKTYRSPNLSVIDFYKHLATDVVTKNGLPILPENAIRSLASTLGISANQIMPWVSFNVLDTGASVFAVAHAGSNISTILSGSTEWGVREAINTFGVGSLEVASGIASNNPILLASGATDIACGIVSAHDYYTQPFIAGVPVTDLLESTTIGASISALLAIIEVANNKDKALSSHLSMLGERIGTGGLLSTLSTIATPLGITASLGLTGYKLVRKMSESANEVVKALPLTGEFSNQIDHYIAEKYLGKERLEKMLKNLG
jgi:hypothetical protein